VAGERNSRSPAIWADRRGLLSDALGAILPFVSHLGEHKLRIGRSLLAGRPCAHALVHAGCMQQQDTPSGRLEDEQPGGHAGCCVLLLVLVRLVDLSVSPRRRRSRPGGEHKLAPGRNHTGDERGRGACGRLDYDTPAAHHH
jgi:hypothetical protein